MICPKCGTQLPDDAKFCGSCGEAIPQKTVTPVSQPEPADTPVNSVEPESTADANSQDNVTPVNNESQNNFNPNGAPQGGFNPNGATQNGFNPEQVINKATDMAKSNPILPAVAGVVIVALVVIVLIAKVISGGSYKDTIKERYKFLNKRKTNVMEYFETQNSYGKAAADFNYLITMKTEIIGYDYDDEKEWKEEYAENIEDFYDYYDDEYGDDWKFTYEIKKATKLKDSKLDDFQDMWEDYVDYCEERVEYLEDSDDYDEDDIKELSKLVDKMSKKEVKKGYKVKLKTKIKGDDESEKENIEWYVLKIGSDWVITSEAQ